MRRLSIIKKLKFNLSFLQEFVFLLIVFFLPTQFGKHFWPDFSLVDGARIDYLSPTIYFTDCLLLLLISLLVLGFAKKNDPKRIIKYIKWKGTDRKSKNLLINFRLWLFIAIICISLLISIVYSQRPLLGIYGFIKYFEFVIFGWIVARQFKKEYLFQQSLYVFGAAMLLESVLAILQFLNQGSIGGIWYFLGERTFTGSTPGIANASIKGELVLRPYGTLSHPNVLAGYLLFGMALLLINKKNLLSQFFRTFRQKHKKLHDFKAIYLGCVLLSSTAALFLTMSRTATLLFLGASILFLINSIYKKNKFYFSRTVYVIVSIISVSGLFFLASPRFLSTSLSEEAVVERGQLTASAISMLKDHPVFGVGVREFLVVLPHYLKQPAVYYIQPVHNIFLLFITETGAIGFILLMLFAFWLLKIVKTNKVGRQRGALVFLVFILIIGVMDHYLLTLQQGVLLLSYIFGIILSSSKKDLSFVRVKNNRKR